LGRYEEAKKSLQIGLGKNPSELFLLGNLADYYLQYFAKKCFDYLIFSKKSLKKS